VVTNDGRLVRPKLKFERDYMMLPNKWVRPGAGLSLKAIGLLAQLMSHDEGFSVTFRQLARENKDGDAAVRSAVAELRAAGYLHLEQERYRGKIVGSIWVLSDPSAARQNQLELDPEKPHAEKPRVGKPRVGKPHVENQHAIEVLAREDLLPNKEISSSTRAGDSEDSLDHLWRVCPLTRSGHAFPPDGGWCACGQARADGALRDRHGVLLREAVSE
jgi:hypothetical protein